MRLSYSSVIRSSLLALLPVIAALALWILLRADNLAQLYQGVEDSFFRPDTAGEAFRKGLVIWFITALACSFIFGCLYSWVTRKWHWQALYYAFLASALGIAVSLTAYVLKIELAMQSTGELIIIAIGFGVFIPWFAQKSLRAYS